MKRLPIVVLFTVIVGMGCSFIAGTPGYAFRDFQTVETKESYLVLPLCDAGNKVVPLVNQRIREKDLTRRRYAIGFLGVYGDDESLSTLKAIVDDESDLAYCRGDALESLFILDDQVGRLKASSYVDRTDFLGDQARRLLAIEDVGRYRDDYRRRVCFPND